MTNTSRPLLTVAIAQGYSPLTLERGLESVHAWAQRARDAGAGVVAFPETFIPGYPIWVDVCRDVAVWNHAGVREVHARMAENSVDLSSSHGRLLRSIAGDLGITIVVGVVERAGSGASRGTLYNSLLVIGSDGALLNHHRKLMPTHGERLVWGIGDTAGLRVVDSDGVRVGGLICWEHWMPLARHALHLQGEEIHIAAWPTVHEMHLVASRHYAFEARCHVLACGSIMRASDLPAELEVHAGSVTSPEQLVLRGGSCVIAPDGSLITQQVFDREELIVAELDLGHGIRENMTLDVAGHYSRDDSLSLTVRNSAERRAHD